MKYHIIIFVTFPPSAFFNYISGGAIAPTGRGFAPSPPVKPFLPPKCKAELLMIAVKIAVDLLDNAIKPWHSLLHGHLEHNSIVLHQMFHNRDRFHKNASISKPCDYF